LSTYNEIDLTFYVDGNLNVKRYFDNWLNIINDNQNNDFKYKNEYVVDIGIEQYDLADKMIYKVSCKEAYPVSMNQMDLDWNSESFHNLTVTFAYRYWVDDTNS
jgi:hypothetical protein